MSQLVYDLQAALILPSWAVVSRWALGVAIVAAVLAPPADALVVMNVDPSNYYVAPTSQTNSGVWGSNADPGWANSTSRGVYLGNGWVLSAKHTGLGTGSETINGEDYNVIANSFVDLKNPTAAVNAGLSSLADLRITRVNTLVDFYGTPEQRAADLGASLQPIYIADSRASTNKQLVAIGNGNTRLDGDSLLHADKSSSSSVNWPDPVPECDGNCLHTVPSSQIHALGYSNQGPRRLAWGTNRVESSTTVANRLQDFDPVSGTNSYSMSVSDRDTLVQAFDFDTYTFNYNSSLGEVVGGGSEIQAAAGDSGSGIYTWNSTASRWELTGVMHTIACYVTRANGSCGPAAALRQGSSAFGDFTAFTELSAYKDQIEAYMAPPEGFEWTGTPGEDARFFSLVGREFGYDAAGEVVLLNEGLWGDVNLDGFVRGDGTGDWATDDVTAFIEGWGHEQAAGDIFSWKQGDLNQDGITDLSDFLLLRSGFQATNGASLSLAAMLGTSSNNIPEPSTMVLLAGGTLALLASRHLRRRRR